MSVKKEPAYVKVAYGVCALLLMAGVAQAETTSYTAPFTVLQDTQSLSAGYGFCQAGEACVAVHKAAYKAIEPDAVQMPPSSQHSVVFNILSGILNQTMDVVRTLSASLPPIPFHLSEQNKVLSWLEGLVALYVFFRLWLAYRRRRAFKGAVQTGKRLINSLADRLQIRRKQLVYQNAYGTTIYDKWEREKAAFMQREMLNCLNEHGYQNYIDRATPELLAYLDKVAFDTPAEPEQKVSNPDVYSPDMNPFDYERYCARLLRQLGWEAIATSECGDQGADVVASRGNTRIILQCKLYTKAVGNDAVQQVAAARQHYGARYGAVVSNAPYTIPAQQLAKTNKIFLLHHDELQRFVKRVEKSSTFRLR
ncbi:restriction endonuclease [Acetobacter cibinongensis]|uniref:restriction endonuclease n=1 Tax=Acetobacter cibinongensis TaxID=146475 RepID=UPI000662B370|nr:restriction endonuclease [Acetobacter cibinongensis]